MENANEPFTTRMTNFVLPKGRVPNALGYLSGIIERLIFYDNDNVNI